MKKLLIGLLTLGSITSFASDNFEDYIGPCMQEYKSEIFKSKLDFINIEEGESNTVYSVDQVLASSPYDLIDGTFKVEMILDVRGHETETTIYTYEFVTSAKNTKCLNVSIVDISK